VSWLNLQSGLNYSLPSESQWEYAARGGSTSIYGVGKYITQKAHCEGCDGWQHTQTISVASFDANAFGLYDMQGNVWQWLLDCYKADYHLAPIDGSAYQGDNCAKYVTRGGGWNNLPSALRAANRSPVKAGVKMNNLGFRVVLN